MHLLKLVNVMGEKKKLIKKKKRKTMGGWAFEDYSLHFMDIISWYSLHYIIAFEIYECLKFIIRIKEEDNSIKNKLTF